MATSAVKLGFQVYLSLNSIEKKKLYQLIKEDHCKERTDKLYSGIAVEHMTLEEEKLLKMVLDLRENAVYLDP